MGQRLTVLLKANLPAPGNLPAKVNDYAVGGFPVLHEKANVYGCVEFGFRSDSMGSGDYALYKWWPEDQDWKPEGPRGATPATIDMATVSGQVPVRISVEEVAAYLCVVLCAGAGVVGSDSGIIPCVLQDQIR